MADSWLDRLQAAFMSKKLEKADPRVLLQKRITSANAGIDPYGYSQPTSSMDSGGMPEVTQEELEQQLRANYFHLPSEERHINSPSMQAIKNQIQFNRMQLLMQQAKNKKREIGI